MTLKIIAFDGSDQNQNRSICEDKASETSALCNGTTYVVLTDERNDLNFQIVYPILTAMNSNAKEASKPLPLARRTYLIVERDPTKEDLLALLNLNHSGQIKAPSCLKDTPLLELIQAQMIVAK